MWSIAVKYSCFQFDTPAGWTIPRIRDAYADNTSLMKTVTAEEYNNMASVLKLTSEMKEISQNFERKLFSTGGSLILKKCFWYLISWRREADGSSTMVTRDHLPREI